MASKKAQAATKNTQAKIAKNQEQVKAFAFPTTKSINQKIANSVKTSWEDPATRAARTKRDGVRVTVNGCTTEHTSLRKAFTSHKLPDRQHQDFRRSLKKAGNANFYHEGWAYTFEIIDLNKVEAPTEVKVVEPKFKVGDAVRLVINRKFLGTIFFIDDMSNTAAVAVDPEADDGEEWDLDELELVPAQIEAEKPVFDKIEPAPVFSIGTNVAHVDVPDTLLGNVVRIQKHPDGDDLATVSLVAVGGMAVFNASNLVEFTEVVETKREPVRFDSLPLLCGFYMEEAKLNRATLEYPRPVSYVKVGNTSAIAVPVAFDDYPQREIRDPFIYLAHATTIDLSVKCRFKKSTKVFPIYPITK
jgi:hypothetical protein